MYMYNCSKWQIIIFLLCSITCIVRRRNDDVKDWGYCAENYRRHQFRRKLGSIHNYFPELMLIMMTMMMIMAAMMIL